MQSEYNLAGSVAFSYARFSDPSQASGHSLERQQSYAPQFCEEYGCTLDASLSFSDSGRSAFHGRHISEGAGLSRFVECIQAGRVQPNDILIVENLDRMSRLPLEKAEDLLKSILSKGVRIHTRSPWAIYDRGTLNDPMQRMQMIFEFTRSHQESKYKQERLSRRWVKNREDIRSGEYFLANCPAWLKTKRSKQGDSVGYEIDESRVAIVRQIFQLCVDGIGMTSIVKKLNQDGVPTFGSSKNWARSTVSKILHNRAVLGEYQPFTSVSLDGRDIRSTARVSTGDPVKDHFPRIISDDVFESAALALHKRKTVQAGAGTSKVVNLFAGLLVDVRDGSSMQVIDKGYGPQLVSTSGQDGTGDAAYVPYAIVERAFVAFADQMPLDMIAPKDTQGIDRDIKEARKAIESIELQVEKIRQKLKITTSDVLLDLLVDRDADLKEKRNLLATLERQKGTSATLAAKTSKDLLKKINSLKGDELLAIRSRIRNEFRYWIRQVNILPLKFGTVKAAIVCVELTNGERIDFRASAEPIRWPTELDDLDILNYAKWSPKLKKKVWDAMSERDEKVLELSDEGDSFNEISKKTGLRPSVISKLLIKYGRRRKQRTTLGKDRAMTWNSAANGWQRIYKGNRYYVGVGTLTELYPRLVKSSDEVGTLKAANRWWTEHGPKE
jgi:DNA invertase Pin-like site-specific DNA recombinase